MLLPLVGLLTAFSPDFKNPFWLKCAGLILYAITAGWFLHRIEKGTMKWPAIGWIFSASYFTLFLSVLWKFFGGASSAFFFFGAPELGGLISSLIGLIYWTLNHNKKGEQADSSNGG
jgi:hypothetical protein